MESLIDNLKDKLNEIKHLTALAKVARGNIIVIQRGLSQAAMDINDKVYDILAAITEIERKSPTDNRIKIDWIDEAQRFLAQEYCPNWDNMDTNLFNKVNTILNASNNCGTKNLQILAPLGNKVAQAMTERASYKTGMPPPVIIVVAVPVEYLAVFRKFELTILGKNDFFYKIKNDKRDRHFTWVEAILKRSDKYSRVALLFPEKYGSLSIHTSISEYLNDRNYNIDTIQELLLVGIAGHLDKNNDVNIGDLVISSKFYCSYDRKQENIASFSDTNLHGKPENIPPGINLDTWRPMNLLEELPEGEVNDNIRAFQKIKIGPFVSGPEVVKNQDYKELLQSNFDGALAVEMEAAGCYEVVRGKECNFTIIKSICDYSDNSKGKKMQPYCADIAVEFTIDYILAKYGTTAQGNIPLKN